ncbi:hypothetical protein UlMin_030144 [Ulmus minor]
MVATSENSPPVDQPPENNKQIRKAFKFLKTHASAVANFTLQWQDLEDHFKFIQTSIQSKLEELEEQRQRRRPNSPEPQSDSVFESEANSEGTQLKHTLQSQSKVEETQLNNLQTQLKNHESFSANAVLQSGANSEGTQSKLVDTQMSNFQSKLKNQEKEESLSANRVCNGISLSDGKALLVHVKERLNEQDSSFREDVRNALKCSEDCGKLVLEAIGGFYPLNWKRGVIDSELGAIRRCCVLLLEELMEVRPLIKPEVRDLACKLALEWKAKMKVEMVYSMEVFAFLLLLAAYELVGEFQSDEILRLMINVVQRRQAIDLFRALGFADKASEFIQILIAQKNGIEAVKFIYAFELVNEFPPVPLLKAHIKDAKNYAKTSWKKGKKSPKDQDDAANNEIAALRSVVRCITDYKLESEYSSETLKKRIMLLRMQKSARKATPTASGPNARAQKQSGKKWAVPDHDAQTRNHNVNTHPRIAPLPSEAPNVSAHRAITAVHPLHHRPVTMFEGAAEYSIPSSRMAASAATDPSPRNSFGAASNYHSMEASHHRAEGSLTGQVPHYSSGYYHLPRSIYDTHTSLPAQSYALAGSPHVNQHTSSTSRAYSLAGSTPVSHHLASTAAAHYGLADPYLNTSAELYGTSAAPSGIRSSTSTGNTYEANPLSSLAYFYSAEPLKESSYSERPVSSSSGYESLPKRSSPYIFKL